MVRAVIVGCLLVLAGCSQVVMNGIHGSKLQRGPEDCVESAVPIVIDGTLAAGATTLSVLAFHAMPASYHDDTMTFDGALAETATRVGQIYTVTVGLAAAALAVELLVSASRGSGWRRECRIMKRSLRRLPDRERRDVELDY
jgi:hypothetical protein